MYKNNKDESKFQNQPIIDGEHKHKSKKDIIFIVVSLLIICVFIIFKDALLKKDKVNTEINITNNNKLNNIKKDTDQVLLNLDIETKLSCVELLDDFEDGKNLETEDYLNCVYHALNRSYISTSGDNRRYTESDINDIVYSIFGVNLKENKSVSGLKYNDGIYILSRADGDAISTINNITTDVVSGTTYAKYDLCMIDSFEKQSFVGRYEVVFAQDAENGNMYIRSKKLIENSEERAISEKENADNTKITKFDGEYNRNLSKLVIENSSESSFDFTLNATNGKAIPNVGELVATADKESDNVYVFEEHDDAYPYDYKLIFTITGNNNNISIKITEECSVKGLSPYCGGGVTFVGAYTK